VSETESTGWYDLFEDVAAKVKYEARTRKEQHQQLERIVDAAKSQHKGSTMTDREEFEAWKLTLSRGTTIDPLMAWQACAAIKQRRIDELETQLRQIKAGSGGIAQNSPAGGHGMSGTRLAFAEPIVMVYGGRGGITQDVNGPTHPEPQEPKP